jgi:predicted nuclease of predicted toxin-antitoxin system
VKFLADMNISLATVRWLRAQGHDATHLRELGLQREIDENILLKARNEQCILLTMDLDFGYLLAVSGEALPSVILLRLGTETAEVVNQHLAALLALDGLEWESGLVSVHPPR